MTILCFTEAGGDFLTLHFLKRMKTFGSLNCSSYFGIDHIVHLKDKYACFKV